MFGFGFLFGLLSRASRQSGATYTPALDFSDPRNSQYFLLIF